MGKKEEVPENQEWSYYEEAEEFDEAMDVRSEVVIEPDLTSMGIEEFASDYVFNPEVLQRSESEDEIDLE